MSYSNLAHLKTLLMVLTAAGTVTGGVVANSFAHKDPGSFIIGLNPSSMFLVQNTTSTSTVSITSINSFSGTVGLSISFQGPGIASTISPTSVNLAASSVAQATLTVTATVPLGTYSIIVTGISSSHGKTTYSAAMLTVQVVSSQDFSITSSPSSITSLTGATNTTTITVTSVDGYSGNVSLTVTAPFGYITTTGGQNPLTITSSSGASTTLTITTASNTVPGTYSIIVTGTDGVRSHSTTISLQVVDPVPFINESLNLIGRTFNNGTSLTLVLQNTGNGSITLTSYTIRDASGDAWSLTGWPGPAIGINMEGSANVLIGSSCPSCVYTGISGLFLQFQPGQTYTVTLTTARGNQFTFTVTD